MEKRAVYRFRYDVYVQEMDRYSGVARNMFVVLGGTLEVRDGEKLLRVLGPGHEAPR